MVRTKAVRVTGTAITAVSTTASQTPSLWRIQFLIVNPCGKASGKPQKPAKDQTANTIRPSKTAIAAAEANTSDNPATNRSNTPRDPLITQNMPRRPTNTSPNRHTIKAPMTNPSCNRAAEAACTRNAKSGSDIQRTICTDNVLGVLGPKMTATSTTDIA